VIVVVFSDSAVMNSCFRRRHENADAGAKAKAEADADAKAKADAKACSCKGLRLQGRAAAKACVCRLYGPAGGGLRAAGRQGPKKAEGRRRRPPAGDRPLDKISAKTPALSSGKKLETAD
jgi:hypothetical protein